MSGVERQIVMIALPPLWSADMEYDTHHDHSHERPSGAKTFHGSGWKVSCKVENGISRMFQSK